MTVIYDSILHKFRTRDQSARLLGALMYKGELPSVTSLGLLVNKQLGDWYRITGGPEAGADYYYDGTDWNRVGGEFGTGYVTSEQAESIASDTAESMIHNGSLTISQGYWEEIEEGGETYWSSGTSVVSFTANAASNVYIDIPAFQSATVIVSQGGSALGSFTSLDPEDVTIELASPGVTVMYGQNPVSSLVRGANIDMTMGSSGALTIAGSVYPVKYNGANVTEIVQGTDIHMYYDSGALYISGVSRAPTPTYSGAPVSAIASGANASMTYNQSTGTLTIGAVPAGSGILTISQGGTSKGQFSANSPDNVSIALDEVEHLSLAIPKSEDTSQALHVVIERKEQGSWEGVLNTVTDYARVKYFSGLEFVAMTQGGIPATFGGNMCDIDLGQLLEHGDECRLKWTVAGDTNHELDSDWEGFIWPNAPGTVGRGGEGEQGPQGEPGSAATIEVRSTTTVAPGSSAVVSNVGNSNAAVLDFYIPRGSDGINGTDGSAATIQVASTITVAPGSTAVVSNTGTANAAVLDFYIPQGIQGAPGEDGTNGADGAAATIEVRSVHTVAPSSQAVVSNVGTTNAALLDFYIPRGMPGTMSYQGIPITGFVGGSGISLAVFSGQLVITNTGGSGSSGGSSGGTGIVVSSGQSFIVQSNAYYTGVTVSSGGSLIVSSGTVANVTVDLGGNITVASGGTALQVDAAPMEPVVSVAPGGVIDYVVLSGYYYRPASGGPVSSGTALAATTMGSAGALLKIYDGGIATNTVVKNGEVHVYSNGQLRMPTILSSGSCFVYSNGIVSYGNVGSAVNGTWGPELYIKGGTATVTSVNKGGTLYVYSSGSAISVIDSFGLVHIGSDGEVSGISGGGAFSSGGTRAMIHVWQGGKCYDAIISSIHSCVVHDLGSAVNLQAGISGSATDSGWVDVYAGGFVSSATISPTGIIRVYSAAVVDDINLETWISGNASLCAELQSATGAVVTNITSGAKAKIVPTTQVSDPYTEPDWI